MVTPFLQGFCGGDSLSLYSVYIFKKSNVALNGYVLSMLLQVGFTVGYVVSVPFMGHVGRRPQYFVSSILLATAMVVLGASLYALVSVRALQNDTSETTFLKIINSLTS